MGHKRGQAARRLTGWLAVAAIGVVLWSQPGRGAEGRGARAGRDMDAAQGMTMFRRMMANEIRTFATAKDVQVDLGRLAVGFAGGGAAVAPVASVTANDDWEAPVAVVVVGAGERSRLRSGSYLLKLKLGERDRLLFDLIDLQGQVVHSGVCRGDTATTARAVKEKVERKIEVGVKISLRGIEIVIKTQPADGGGDDGGEEEEGGEEGGEGEGEGDGGCTVPLPI